MAVRITCINKSAGHANPHHAIDYLGWIEDGTGKKGKTSRVDMYEWVKSGGLAYVTDSKGDRAYLIHEISPAGTKFVKTKPDNTKADNLLALGECPFVM